MGRDTIFIGYKILEKYKLIESDRKQVSGCLAIAWVVGVGGRSGKSSKRT